MTLDALEIRGPLADYVSKAARRARLTPEAYVLAVLRNAFAEEQEGGTTATGLTYTTNRFRVKPHDTKAALWVMGILALCVMGVLVCPRPFTGPLASPPTSSARPAGSPLSMRIPRRLSAVPTRMPGIDGSDAAPREIHKLSVSPRTTGNGYDPLYAAAIDGPMGPRAVTHPYTWVPVTTTPA
jgi:hypothetical protein